MGGRPGKGPEGSQETVRQVGGFETRPYIRLDFTMRRFYAHPRQFSQDLVTLDPEETFHLARVLRLLVGARVEVCDGEGGNFAAEVAALEPRGATLRILGKLDSWGESPLPLVLGIGLAKGEAMDEAVRQATEMGVTRIFPFISERSERLTPERAERRRKRWSVWPGRVSSPASGPGCL